MTDDFYSLRRVLSNSFWPVASVVSCGGVCGHRVFEPVQKASHCVVVYSVLYIVIMESLPQTTRESICKMNTLKVKSKLVKGGMKEEEVEKLDRAAALEKLAAQFLAGKHNP